HPRAFGAGERSALGHVWHALGGGEGVEATSRIAALDQPALDEAAASYLAELHALAPEAARVVDKMPGNFNYLGFAALMLPGARIIRSARHRLVDLYFPLLRLPSLRARPRRSRLVHRPARSPDDALARGFAEPVADRAARGLGQGFHRHLAPRAGISRSAL